MNIETYQIWIIISILLFIAEIFLPTFLAFSLAIGCLASAAFTFLSFGFEGQVIAFSIGTLVSFFGVRPFMLKYAHRNSSKIKTNMDALEGKIGRVSVTIDNSKNEGRVIIDGDNWRAESENDEVINEGEKVEVVKLNSTILIVKPIIKN